MTIEIPSLNKFQTTSLELFPLLIEHHGIDVEAMLGRVDDISTAGELLPFLEGASLSLVILFAVINGNPKIDIAEAAAISIGLCNQLNLKRVLSGEK